ncbi:hypothetical protein, partial [Rhodoferax sp.]|uniref:hypothetical protein n=1 Tax=Rhodoferax sp. TaxID=50421 RepID=UPI0025E365DB
EYRPVTPGVAGSSPVRSARLVILINDLEKAPIKHRGFFTALILKTSICFWLRSRCREGQNIRKKASSIESKLFLLGPLGFVHK